MAENQKSGKSDLFFKAYVSILATACTFFVGNIFYDVKDLSKDVNKIDNRITAIEVNDINQDKLLTKLEQGYASNNRAQATRENRE